MCPLNSNRFGNVTVAVTPPEKFYAFVAKEASRCANTTPTPPLPS